MAGRVATARAELAAVLAPVLPDRVYPYQPARPAAVGPAVWVAEFAAGWIESEWSATFAVRLIADGADRAVMATLDELADAAYAAVIGSDDFYPDEIRFEPFDADATTTLPSYVFDVSCPVAAATWCRPAPPTSVPIPTPTA